MQPLGARGKAGHPTDGHILRSRNWPFDPFIFCPQPLRPKNFLADHTKGKRWILQDWSASGELSRDFLAASSFAEKDRNLGREEAHNSQKGTDLGGDFFIGARLSNHEFTRMDTNASGCMGIF